MSRGSYNSRIGTPLTVVNEDGFEVARGAVVTESPTWSATGVLLAESWRSELFIHRTLAEPFYPGQTASGLRISFYRCDGDCTSHSSAASIPPASCFGFSMWP